LREAAQLVSAKTISPRRVAAALQFAHPLEERCRRQEGTLRELRDASHEASQMARRLTEENTHLRQRFENASARARELDQQSERLVGELASEKDRLHELEQFWEKRSEQALARLRHRIVTELAHDLQEASLALDRESPNCGMALSRVRRAEQTLRTLEQPK
jgi:predicted nuclease with TOPRIM domain